MKATAAAIKQDQMEKEKDMGQVWSGEMKGSALQLDLLQDPDFTLDIKWQANMFPQNETEMS